MFYGHVCLNHEPDLRQAAGLLLAQGLPEAPYNDGCLMGSIRVGARDAALGGVIGTVFTVIPRDQDAEQGARKASFIIPIREIPQLIAEHTVN